MACELENKTDNPICSDSLQDLKNNTIIMDQYINSEEFEVPDRLGIPRKTWAGLEEDVRVALANLDPKVEQLIADKIIAQGGVEIANEWGDSLTNPLNQRIVSDFRLETITALKERIQATHGMKLKVGESEQFTTINDAIEYSLILKNSKLSNEPSGSNTRLVKGNLINIELQTGFIMKEQVFINGLNLSNICITSVETEVLIDRSSLNISAYFSETDSIYPAFFVSEGGTLPIIACKFKMDDTGDFLNRTGIFALRSSKVIVLPYCGVTHCGGVGLYLRESSSASARLGLFNNSNSSAILVTGGSYIDAHGCDVSNSYVGISAYDSLVDAERSKADNCTLDGYVFGSASNVNAQLSSALNCGRNGLRADTSSNVMFSSSDTTGCIASGVFANSAKVHADNLTVNSCGTGVRVIDGGEVSGTSISAKNCGRGVQILNNSSFTSFECDTSGYSEFGIYANNMSRAFINDSKNRKDGVSDSNTDIICGNGSSVLARGSEGGTSIPVGQWSVNGFIIK